MQKLEALGLILVDRAQFENGNNAINVYRLRFRAFGGPEPDEMEAGDDPGGPEPNQGVGQILTQGGLETDPGVGQKDTPQQTDSQQTVKQESVGTAPPPSEESSVKDRKNGTGGAEVSDSRTAEKPSPPQTESPLTGDDSEIVRLLVGFGVWRSRARQLVQTLNLTPALVKHACRALHEEAEQGATFTNPAAILASPPDGGLGTTQSRGEN